MPTQILKNVTRVLTLFFSLKCPGLCKFTQYTDFENLLNNNNKKRHWLLGQSVGPSCRKITLSGRLQSFPCVSFKKSSRNDYGRVPIEDQRPMLFFNQGRIFENPGIINPIFKEGMHTQLNVSSPIIINNGLFKNPGNSAIELFPRNTNLSINATPLFDGNSIVGIK